MSYTLKGPGLDGPGFELVEKVARTIDQHNMLGDVSPPIWVVAISGGPDSACLFDVLQRLRATFDFELFAAHVDHGLSDESAEISARVSTEVAAAGFEAHVVKAPDLAGPNLHARAREFRYGFFEIVMQQTGADRVATGHTLDDRVETTLARLIHGAGTESLAGVTYNEEKRVRPLLDIRRAETREYCEERGLAFVDDPANEDPRFERSFIRSELMRAIEQRWGDGAIRAMAKSAHRLKEDASFLADLADNVYGQLAKTEGDEVRFELAAIEGLPRPMQRRLLERAVGRIRDRAGGIEPARKSVV